MGMLGVLDVADRKNRPVRLSEAALKWAKIASGCTGESMADYCSRVLEERGKADARALLQQAFEDDEAPPRKGGGK